MWKISVLVLLLASLLPQTDPSILIDHVTIVDGNGGAPIQNGEILIQGERILQLGSRGSVTRRPGSTVIDARNKFVIPGLIDAHIHFDQSGDVFTRPDAVDLRRVRPYMDELQWTKDRTPVTLLRYLACGITSVVDMGGPLWSYDVRAMANSSANAPRVAVAGRLIATAGEGSFNDADPPLVYAETPEMGRSLVRENAKHHPDLTKILFIRGDRTLDQQFEVVKAVTEESHALGIRVAVHATELELAKLALRAGADVLVHSVEDKIVDREFLDLAKKNNVLYVTTLIVNEGYDEVLGEKVKLNDIEQRLGDLKVIATWAQLAKTPVKEIPGGVPTANLRDTQQTQFKNLMLVQAAGIRIAAGSDAGNIGTLHGPALHREFELMAQAGMRAADVLVAATKNAAAVMGKGRDIGTLERGKYADLVILDADPTRDVRNNRKISNVMKNGVLLNISADALK